VARLLGRSRGPKKGTVVLNQARTKIVAMALVLKRRLAIRTRFNQLRFRLWKARYGVRLIHNFFVDLWWGGYCGGIKHSPYAHLGAMVTQSMDYAQLSYLFTSNDLPVYDSDVLVDVGCGKGRVINFWLGRRLCNRIIGIELDEEIARVTRNRLARYSNVEIMTGDATQSLPEDGTFFFLFNPFDADVMRRFLERLKQLREVRVIYWYCLHVGVVKNDPFWSVEELRTGDHKPGVLIRRRTDVIAQRDDAETYACAPGARLHGLSEQSAVAPSPTAG
jgi:hypothetical protein